MRQETAEMLINIINAQSDVMRLKGRASQHILIHLAHSGGKLPLKELYLLPLWTNKTLRNHILHLENDGMIELLDDPNDGRSKIALLTKKSRCKLAKYEEKIFDVLKKHTRSNATSFAELSAE